MTYTGPPFFYVKITTSANHITTEYTMNQINISNVFYLISSNHMIIFSVFSVLVSIKIFLLNLINQYRKKTTNASFLFLLMIPIVTYIISELAIYLNMFHDNNLSTTFWRIAWNMQPIQFYSQILFIKTLLLKRYVLRNQDKLVLCVLGIFVFFPLLLLFVDANESNIFSFLFFKIFCTASFVKRIAIKISGYFFLIFALYTSWKKISELSDTPHILRLQLRKFFVLLLLPLIPDSLEIINPIFQLHECFSFSTLRLFDLLSLVSFTTALLFFVRHVYHLRFLNFTSHVETGPTVPRASEKLLHVKNALCQANNIFELPYIHATFFDQLAGITPDRVIFLVRTPEKINVADSIEQIVEQYIQEKSELLITFCADEGPVLVYDELAFTYFYEKSETIADILSFMDQIHATIFVPLKEKNRILGSIVITKDPHNNELFPLVMQTQIQLYGTYVTYTLSRFEQEKQRSLLETHKNVSLELYKTNQKNARFYESVVSLLKTDSNKKNGILFYKNTRFIKINTITETFLQIDPNLHHGHPLTKALKELVRRVLQYNTPQSIVEKNISGQAIYCQGFPYKNDELIILVTPADVTNSLSLEQAILHQSDIDYTIFLYATIAGQIINEAIPGGKNIIEKTKIDLLKILLSKKAMLLDVHSDDIQMILSIAQKVCHKSTVHTIDLASNSTHDNVMTLLFGRQLFTATEILSEHGLLYTFDQSGIIHIANAHLMQMKTQQFFLQFLKTGSFCLYKSEQRYTSNATIIMSSNENLEILAKQGIFSQELYNYFKDTVITLPNLVTVPFSELSSVAHAVQKQLVVEAEYHHILGFTTEQQKKLDSNRPLSYHELRLTINTWVKQHIAQSALNEEATCNSEIITTNGDSILLQAARLGKQTLKDRKLMRALWDKFQNQSKIAQFLDVDRSSVHRRLKEYRIGTTAAV